MIDLTIRKEDKEGFITDLTKLEEGLLVTYADGHTKLDTMYSEHNHNVYRREMIKQVETYGDEYMSKLGRESFKLFFSKYTPIVLSVIGLYYAYNMDISTIMKILLSLGVVTINIANLIINEIWCTVMAYDLDKTEAYMYYKKHLNDYVINGGFTDQYILPIEDIDKHDLTFNQVKEISNTIKEYRSEFGDDIAELKLTYKKNDSSK